MGRVRVVVDLAALRAAVAEVQGAATVTTSLREHPGQLAGRAADAGDDELSAAIVTFGSRWDWGWGILSGDVERWAALLSAVVDTYELVERVVLDGGLAARAEQRMFR